MHQQLVLESVKVWQLVWARQWELALRWEHQDWSKRIERPVQSATNEVEKLGPWDFLSKIENMLIEK